MLTKGSERISGDDLNEYTNAIQVMTEMFGRDYQFALATSSGNIPSQRYVDTYYDGEYFYVVAYGLSKKVRDIRENPNVSLCTRNAHSFSGIAEVIGHPKDTQNSAMREKLISVFEKWYFLHNNEDDENMCYIRIKPLEGFFHKDGTGYTVDFVNRTAKAVPFAFSIVITED